jgi:hypothetical protein
MGDSPRRAANEKRLQDKKLKSKLLQKRMAVVQSGPALFKKSGI